MRVSFLQTYPIFGKIKDNVEKVFNRINSTDANLFVLPELFNTGYQFKSKKEVSELSEDLPDGYTTKTLIEIGRKKKIFIVAGIAEKGRGRFYNSSILIGPKGLLVSIERHIFSVMKKNCLQKAIHLLRYIILEKQRLE